MSARLGRPHTTNDVLGSAPGPHLQAADLDCAVAGRTILRGVNLDVQSGERIGLVGPNGSGKSTLLRVLAGLRPPADGGVVLRGRPLAELRARERAREIAVVAQEEEPAGELLVGELVALGLIPHRRPWAAGGAAEREAVAAALRSVDLAGYEHRPVISLSGGERRRALLARGLAQQAPLLVLDEPTNHLDIRHQLDLLARLSRVERTVVLSLHDLNLAMRFCDRVAVLARGELRAFGPPQDVLTPALIADVFDVRASLVRHPRNGASHLLLDLPQPAYPSTAAVQKAHV